MEAIRNGADRPPLDPSLEASALLGFGAALALLDQEYEIARLTAGAVTSALSVRVGAVVLNRSSESKVWLAGNTGEKSHEKQVVEEIERLVDDLRERHWPAAGGCFEIGIGPDKTPNLDATGLRRLLVCKLRTISRELGIVLAGSTSAEGASLTQHRSLQILATQASLAIERAELNRERLANELALRESERRLRESQERLSRTVESAMDAIITIDRNRNIVLFNPAAEKVFRCSAASVMEKSFDRFLTETPLTLLDQWMKQPEGREQPYRWIPEGLRARRADLQEFPFEATVSRMQAGGESLFTIILRDINDRKQAELELQELRADYANLREVIAAESNFEDIVARSPQMKKVFRSIEQVAATDSTVLILGETGTGKELIARSVHNLSKRKDKIMVKVNCAALPPGLIESELFGHEKGAFTGAIARKIGRFELANGSTIFLDEIGELPLDLQSKLLRVLQEGEFERLGASSTIKTNVRVIAATNRDLEKEVREARFRMDLYYRLNVFPLTLPPLRERDGDIELLVRYFLLKYASKLGKRIESIPRQSMQSLAAYSWPGNVRELENVIERAVILSQGPVLGLGDWLPKSIAASGGGPIKTLEESEREHILKTLRLTGWRVSGKNGAAVLLGIKPTTLEARMKKLDIHRLS